MFLYIFSKGEESIKKLTLLIFSFCFILAFLTSCSLTTDSSLLKAPVFENEEYLIYNTLKNSIYSNSSLFLDIPESKKSAIIFLNNKNSAVLFYNTKEKSNLKMALFNKIDSTWKYILDIPLGNAKLLDVLTTKNKEENSEFLIVGTKKNKEKIYTIFSIEGNNINKIFSNTYNYINLFDKQNGEDKSLIALVDYISLSKMKENKNVEITKDLENEINSFEKELKNINNDPEKINRFLGKAIYLFINLHKNKIKVTDYLESYGVGSFVDLKNPVCEIFNTKTLNAPALFLAFSRKEEPEYKNLYAIFYKNNSFYGLSITTTTTPSSICYLDIDKNNELKYIDCTNLHGYEEPKNLKHNYENLSSRQPRFYEIFKIETDKAEKETSPIRNWYITKNRYKYDEAERSYINSNHKYGIKYPKDWSPVDFTAKYKNDNQDIDFFLWDGSLEKDSQKFLSISVDYISNENKKNNDYFVLAKKDNLVYYANVYENAKLDNPKYKLTRKQLKDLFFTID